MKDNFMTDMALLPINLSLFDGNTNVTTDSGMTDEMKTYFGT